MCFRNTNMFNSHHFFYNIDNVWNRPFSFSGSPNPAIWTESCRFFLLLLPLLLTCGSSKADHSSLDGDLNCQWKWRKSRRNSDHLFPATCNRDSLPRCSLQNSREIACDSALSWPDCTLSCSAVQKRRISFEFRSCRSPYNAFPTCCALIFSRHSNAFDVNAEISFRTVFESLKCCIP